MTRPTLLCDKSTIQTLNRGELNLFRRYFNLNVPPILLSEIVSDLSKEFKDGLPADEVRGLARKIVPGGSYINVPFQHLIEMELDGGKVPMNGVPCLAEGRAVHGEEGQLGTIVAETLQEEALLRWQAGEFEAAEKATATLWRERLRIPTLEEAMRQARANNPEIPKCANLREVAAAVDAILDGEAPVQLVAWFLRGAGGTPSGVAELAEKVSGVARGKLRERFPYTYHCLRTALIFNLGMLTNRLGTKESNKLDVEYLYYAPFCQVFSSGDRFLVDLASVALPPGCRFLARQDLKNDLSGRLAQWEKLADEEKTEELQWVGPPDEEGSVISLLWKELIGADYRRQRRTIPADKQKVLTDLALALADSLENGKPLPPLAKGVLEVTMRKYKSSVDGPCSCFSGKSYRECCGKGL